MTSKSRPGPGELRNGVVGVFAGRVRYSGVAVAALVVILGSGCTGGGVETDDSVSVASRLLVARGVARETPTQAPVKETVAGMTAFGYDLYRASADPAANTVLSPMSIAYAFGMARAGARGATADQLDRVFGFPAGGPHAALNVLSQTLATIDGPPPSSSRGPANDHKAGVPAPPLVAIANALFVQDGFQVKRPFLHTLAAQYGAGVRAVDFGSSAAKEAIDAWVREQTANRIKQLFAQLDPTTLLVIANAVYFKGDWLTRFDQAQTAPAPFTRADDSVVDAPMMHGVASYRYAAGPGWQVVELPYAHGDLAMWVLVPRGATTPGDLLTPHVLETVANRLREMRQVDLSLPRWDFGTTVDLRDELDEIGLTDLTNFGGISDDRLYVSDAIHRANITVDEQGTEAAAVTGIAFTEIGARPAIVPTVRADHPFAFAIVHRPTKTPLFIGHVADPTDTTGAASTEN
jgi:serine protease inhibitor